MNDHPVETTLEGTPVSSSERIGLGLPKADADTAAGVTRTLARFAANARELEIDDAARHEASRSLISWLGCALGGASHETVDIAVTALRDMDGAGRARLVGRNELVSPMDAALVNGISASVLDFDATQGKLTNIHPSGPVLPALFAFCEGRTIRGEGFLRAYVVGVEIACRVANGVFGICNPGWHVTGACGGLGAATAVGCLLDLDEERMLHALGTAATQASGFRQMYGTMCKSFTPGRVGQNGFLAAHLARRGFTSAEQALEGKTALASVMTATVPAASTVAGLGHAPFEITANIHKPFPCAIVTHAAIDGCLQLRNAHDFEIESVDHVRLAVSPIALELAGNSSPTSGLEAKFSIFHTVALALVKGRVSYRDFSDQTVADAEVISFRSKIRADADDRLSKLQARIEIHLKDGRVLSRSVRHALGSADNPMTDQDLAEKLMDLASGVVSAARAIIDACWKVDRLSDMSELVNLTVPGSP